MSFYRNISNAERTNLIFDKIYSNQVLKQGDGVFINCYVLTEYDDNTFSRLEGYINKENNDNIIYADLTARIEILENPDTPEVTEYNTFKQFGLKYFQAELF